MNTVAAPSKPVTALLKALGLDGKRVIRLNIGLHPSELVTVTVTSMVGVDEFDNLVREVSHYKLVPHDEPLRPPRAGGEA